MADLTLISDATLEPVTVSEAKDYLRIDSDLNVEENLISTMIKSARMVVEQICGGLCIFPQTWLQVQPFCGAGIDLYRQPVTNVDYVVRMDSMGERDTLTEGSDYRLYKDRLLPGNGVFGGIFTGSFELQYTAGLTTSSTDVPANIKTAVLQLVAFWYQNRDQYYELSVPKFVFPLLSGYRRSVSLL